MAIGRQGPDGVAAERRLGAVVEEGSVPGAIGRGDVRETVLREQVLPVRRPRGPAVAEDPRVLPVPVEPSRAHGLVVHDQAVGPVHVAQTAGGQAQAEVDVLVAVHVGQLEPGHVQEEVA